MELNPFELEEAKELKQEEDTESTLGFRARFSYSDLVNSITDKVNWVIESGFKDYQGDVYYYGEDSEGNTYFVATGYGSCSGCDALEGCKSLEHVVTLRDDIKRDVRKFSSHKEFVDWFEENHELNYYRRKDIDKFIKDFNDKYGITISLKED